MRTTLTIDDDLLADASKSTGIKNKTALVHLALQCLVEGEAYKRLAALDGMMPKLKIPFWRRSH